MTFWDKETHYGITVYLLIIPLTLLFFAGKDLILENKTEIKPELFYVTFFLTGLSVISYVVQKRRLKFKSIKTQLTRDQLINIIKETADKLKWTPHYIDEQVIVLKTHPSFWSGSWGEQITIIMDSDRILINSICDPDRRSSVFSNGRNSQNIETLTARINGGLKTIIDENIKSVTEPPAANTRFV